MLRFLHLPLAIVIACLPAACGGGGSLTPRLAPTAEQPGGPAIARTPLPGAPGPSPQPGAPPAPAQATPGVPQTYTVAAGDTANGIAARLNVPSGQTDAWVRQLLSMNNTTAESLQIGQVLKLPPGAMAAPPAPAPTASGTRPPGATPAANAPVIVQLTSPVGRGQEVTLKVQTGASQGCSPTHLLPNGKVSGAAGLGPRLTDGGGSVTWTFVIPPDTPTGEGSVRVICAGNVVAAPLVVN